MRCVDCGTTVERAGCPNCSDDAFVYTEYLKTRWADEDSRTYEFPASGLEGEQR